MTSPLTDDPNALVAANLARGMGGPLLAVYGSIRSVSRVPDALVGFGLPLIGYLLDSVADDPVRVTATSTHHTAGGPLWGLSTDVDMWTLLVRCRSEMTITVDVGTGPWTAGAGPLELRVEWMAAEQVIALHPRGVSIQSGEPGDGSLGLTGIEERLLAFADELCDRAGDGTLPADLTPALRIVAAARRSASTMTSVSIT